MKPLNGYLFIEKIEEQKLILTTEEKKPNRAKIIASSVDDFKPGSSVIFSEYSTIEAEDYLIIHSSDVLGILND